ncbi:MAG: response regulator [Chitinivibrionia bacterium]|jgi:CheY-like chemotaxis protein|nr:response regulator [Chitinivibrionia bacterium]
MPKIFVADDSALARAFTIKSIQMSGVPDCEFFEAANGLEVMEQIKNIMPDLVISDINMPKCNGIDLSRRLKADTELCDIPLVIMSSAGNKEQRMELEDLGVCAILSKPFTPAEIIQIATEILGNSDTEDSEEDDWGSESDEGEWGDLEEDEGAQQNTEETEGEW